MISVAPLLFDDVLGNAAGRLGVSEVNTLVRRCELDVAPQLFIPKTDSCEQRYRPTNKPTYEPSNACMALVFGDQRCEEDAGKPEIDEETHEVHHESVVATQG